MAIKLVEELLRLDDLKLQLLFLVCLLLPLLFLHIRMKLQRRGLPPGPPRLPFIGNLHQVLGELPHHSLRRLSDQYGPLMLLQLGGAQALVVSSPEMAQQVLRTHDLLFCDRPPLTSLLKLFYGGVDLLSAAYGDESKWTRKLCVSELFSAKKVEGSRSIREEEVGILVSTVSRLSSAGPVNLSEMFLCLFNNIIRRQVSGKRVSEEGEYKLSPLSQMLLEMNRLMGGFSVNDFFPYLSWVDVLTGLRARLETSFRDVDRFLEDEIDTYITEASSGSTALSKENDNLIRTLLCLQKDPDVGHLLSREKIKAILLDVFSGGASSSLSSLEWAMSELMMNPRVMKKVQEEVRRVAGMKEKVDEEDLQQLQYIKLVLKETWRLHPPAPLLPPHQCREECKIAGYTIAAKTWVFVNVWAIARDPKHWSEPELFRPERFEGGSVDYRGQHFELLPFGSGRRMCPAIAQGALEWSLRLPTSLTGSTGSHLASEVGKHGFDMGEALGIVIHRRAPLLLKATLATGIPPE